MSNKIDLSPIGQVLVSFVLLLLFSLCLYISQDAVAAVTALPSLAGHGYWTVVGSVLSLFLVIRTARLAWNK